MLLLWNRAQGVVSVSASGNPDNLKKLSAISQVPHSALKAEEVEESTRVGKTVYFRAYVRIKSSVSMHDTDSAVQNEHMEKDFPVPNLPDGQ